MRDVIADILQALGVQRMTYPTLQQGARMQRGAATLRWCERFEYGDPVPAGEVQAHIDQAVADAEDEYAADYTADIDDAMAEANIARGIAEREVEDLRKLVAPSRLARYDARRAVRS
jgi:hypothetical protein